MSLTIRRHFVSTLVFLLLAFLVPLYFYMDMNVKQIDMNIALAWFIVAYASFQLTILCIRNLERILELTFWIFTYVFMGIVPFVQLNGKQFPWGGFYEQDTITICLLIVILGMICYQIGLMLGNRKQAPPFRSDREINFSTFGFILVSKIAILLTIVSVYKGHGFQALFLPRNDSGNQSDIKSLGLILDQFATVPIFICLILGIWMWKKKKFTHIYGYMMVSLLLVLNLIVSNPISNARLWFGAVLLTILILLIPWSKLGFTRWSFGYLSIFLIVFPYADLFRNKLDLSLKARKVTDFLMNKGDYDTFQMVLNTYKSVELAGFMPGKQLLSTLFFWIPRSIWTDKPYSSGQAVGEALGYKFTNLSCPLWAESYINFGYAGVVIIFILYGYVTNLLQKRYMNSKYSSTITFSQVLVPFLSAYQIYLLRGDLQNGFTSLSMILLMTSLVSLKRPTVDQRLSIHLN